MLMEVVAIALGVPTAIVGGPVALNKAKEIIRKPRIQKKANELFPGVVKPSVILADLVCSRMLRADWEKARKETTELHRTFYRTYTFTDEIVKLTFHSGENTIIVELKVGDKFIALDDHIKRKLIECIQQCKKLNAEKQKALRLAANEQTACDAIEILMGVDKKKEEASVEIV